MKFSRRTFLKLGAAGAAAFGVNRMLDTAPNAMELIMGGAEVSRTTGKYLKPVPSTCLNCYARCGNFGFVAYGTLLKIGPNPNHPNSRGRLCAKGQAGLNLVYDPDRLLFPLKRVGPRGEGEWKRISWEEAYAEILKRLKGVLESDHPEEFVFQSDRDITTQDITRRFVHALGSPNAFVHHPLGGPNKQVAQQLTWGVDYDIPDVANTEYMFPFVSVVECEQKNMIREIGPTLVGSAITSDESFRGQLLDAVHIDRLNVGPVPTIKLNWLQPHEGNIIDFLFRARAYQEA